MLFVVEIDQMDEHEVGFAGTQDVGGLGGAEGIGLRSVPGVAAQRLLAFLVEARGADGALQEEGVLSVENGVLRDVVVDSSAHGNGPGDGADGFAGGLGGVPEGGLFDELGEPVPGAVGAALRVKEIVAQDAVFGRLDAGHHGRVAGVGDGGEDASESGGNGSFVSHFREVGGLQSQPGGVAKGLRFEAVDRDDDHAPVGRLGEQSRGQEEAGQEVLPHKLRLYQDKIAQV
ncbi:MAG: hypothetical protein QM757_43655 [Paludibaculum sp.]